MSQLRKFFSDIGIVTVSQFMLSLQFFIFLPVLTRYLGPTNYGIWSQISLTIAFIGPFAGLGIKASILRFLPGLKDEEKFNKIFSTLLYYTIFFSVIFTFLFLFAAKPLSFFLLKDVNLAYLMVVASILFFIRLIYPKIATLFYAKENFYGQSLFTVIRVAVQITAVLIFVLMGKGVLGVLLGFIVADLLMLTIVTGIVKLYLKYFKFTKPMSFSKIKPYLAYGGWLSVVPAMEWIFQVGDQYILNYYHGVAIVGLYVVPYSLGYIIRKLSAPLFIVLYPRLLTYWNSSRMNFFWKYMDFSYKLVFFFAIPATLGLVVLSDLVILLFAGPKYSQSAMILPFIAVGMGLFTLWKFASLFLKMEKKSKYITIIFFMLALVNIILNFLLIPKYGMMGAGLATLITFFISLIPSIWVLAKVKLDFQLLFLLKSFFSSLVMMFLIMLIKPSLNLHIIPKMIILVAVGGICYLILMYLIKGIDSNDIKFLKEIFLKVP